MEGLLLNHFAELSTLRSSRRSTTERRSRSTMIVPYRDVFRQLHKANDPGRRNVGCGVALELAQDRVVAHRYSETPHQSLSRSPSSMAHMAGDLRLTQGPASMRNCNRRCLVGERAAVAVLGCASPPADAQFHRYSFTLRRVVLKPSMPPTVPSSRTCPAIWADATRSGKTRNRSRH